jgi:hypothetical protein
MVMKPSSATPFRVSQTKFLFQFLVVTLNDPSLFCLRYQTAQSCRLRQNSTGIPKASAIWRRSQKTETGARMGSRFPGSLVKCDPKCGRVAAAMRACAQKRIFIRYCFASAATLSHPNDAVSTCFTVKTQADQQRVVCARGLNGYSLADEQHTAMFSHYEDQCRKKIECAIFTV